MLNRKKATERSKHRKGLIRVFGFMGVVGIACAGVKVGAARAEVGDQSLVIGRQMVTLANSTKNEIHKVSMNGQTMYFASQVSEEPAEKVLGRYEEHCRMNAAQSPTDWKELAATAEKAQATIGANTEGAAKSGGVLRSGDREEGTVMCFVRSSTSKGTMVEALGALEKTGDLGAFGQLRYVYAKRTDHGRTHILAAWTTDKFNVDEMFPPDDDKDAAGHDFKELPRPEGAVRTFSLHLDDAPYGVNIYESSGQSPDQVAKAYDTRLQKEGWFALDLEGPGKRAAENMKGVTGRMYTKDGVMMTVVSHVEHGKTVTGLGIGGVPVTVAEEQSKREKL
jgi:hypothetical protein